MKKLRQWSHGSLINLSQNIANYATNRTNNCSTTGNRAMRTSRSYDDSNLNDLPVAVPTQISTISSLAIDNNKVDYRRDNFGLYALKCDRSSSLASAKKGILLNLPKKLTAARNTDPPVYLSEERTHEVFKSCEASDNDLNMNESQMYPPTDDASSTSNNESKPKIAPPPRKKRRPTATKLLCAHQKPLKKAPQPRKLMQAQLNQIDSIEKNKSELYRIVNQQIAPGRATPVQEPELAKNEHVLSISKPKLETAILQKNGKSIGPLTKQIEVIKDLEFNRKNSKPENGKVQPKKRTIFGTKESTSIQSEESIDIFKAHKTLDPSNLFDEFDALFDKSSSKNSPAIICQPAQAINKRKLSDPKFSSSSFSCESSMEEKAQKAKILTSLKIEPDTKTLPSPVQIPLIVPKTSIIQVKSISSIKTQDFYSKNLPRVKYVTPTSLKRTPSTSSSDSSMNEPLKENVNISNMNNINKHNINSKPEVIYERPKEGHSPPTVNMKRIIYYDDKDDLKDLKDSNNMKNNNDKVLPTCNKNKFNKIDDKVPIKVNNCKTNKDMLRVNNNANIYHSSSAVIKTNKNSLNSVTEESCSDSSTDTERKPNKTSNNNLRLFPNDGVFVFNL